MKLKKDGFNSENIDISMLGTELDNILKDEILKKSQLYIEITRIPASFKYSAGRE